MILLDEPELGLHPHAITLLAAMVKSASVDSQVILATQSPTLLKHFAPEDVIVANRVNGEAKFERLDVERLEVWLGRLQPRSALGNERSWRPDRHQNTVPFRDEGRCIAMARLLIHVEGQTEEAFVDEVLAPHLYAIGYADVSARLMGEQRERERRGGIRPWPEARQGIINGLRDGRRIECHHHG